MKALEKFLRLVGALDSRDDYMKSRGGMRNVRVVGRGGIEQDISEIYNSSSYKEAQHTADSVISRRA